MGFLDYGGGAIDDSSQGFSPRKSTVPFSTVKSLGRGSPAKSPKRKPPQGGATETDSEVGKVFLDFNIRMSALFWIDRRFSVLTHVCAIRVDS